jgi:hypothetical protein
MLPIPRFSPLVTGAGELMQSLLDTGEVGLSQIIGDAGSNRVQIDIGHARQQSLFIKQSLLFKATFPEAPFAAVFCVCLAGNLFIQAAHEPADTAQALAPDAGDFRQGEPFGGSQ